MKKILALMTLLLCLAVCMPDNTASAMTFSSVKPVMEIDNLTGLPGNCRGDLQGAALTLNGQALKIKTFLNYYGQDMKKLAGGSIQLLSSDESKKYWSLPLNKDDNVTIYQISSLEGKDFLLIRKNTRAADGSSALKDLSLLGPKGNKFLTYATMATLKKAGLVFDDIYPEVQKGKILINGFARQYMSASSKYAGVPYRSDDLGIYILTGPVVLSWDDEAQGFSVESVK